MNQFLPKKYSFFLHRSFGKIKEEKNRRYIITGLNMGTTMGCDIFRILTP